MESGGTVRGEFFMKISRFIPDFRALSGNAKVTINLKDFPSDTASSSLLGPFTVSSSTQKVDTRARGRAANLKIENTATDETWRSCSRRSDLDLGKFPALVKSRKQRINMPSGKVDKVPA